VSVLLLRLAAPLQSWGDNSRFSRRETRQEPTKSGVLGLLAAAQGRRRSDPVEDLARLSFGVRLDQPGRLVRDFQTARSLDGLRTMPLSYRYYLADAVFLAAVAGDAELLAGLDEAVRAPSFALFLGRRSCPPTGAVTLGLREDDLETALRREPWQAAPWYRKTQQDQVRLQILRDAETPATPGELVRDHPVSFSPIRREYGWRTVAELPPELVHNDQGSGRRHDPFAALGGG